MTLHARPARIVAIDPGPHVGVAVFEHGRYDPETRKVEDYKDGWRCVQVVELDQQTAPVWLRRQLWDHEVDGLVYETWQLFPDRIKAMVGSKCETAEVIGVIKWLAQEADAAGRPVYVAEMPPGVKLPMPAWCKRRGIKATYKRLGVTGQHCKDAELLGWAYLAKYLPESCPGVAP